MKIAAVACCVLVGGLLIHSRHAARRPQVVHPHAQLKAATGGVADPSYLRLDAGKKWVLRSAKSSSEIILTVESVNDGVATVSFKNPWFDSAFIFQQSGQQIILNALDVKSMRMPMPPGTVYFDFGAPEGTSWQNTIGSIQVAAVHKQLGDYNDCIQFAETNKQGHKNLWSFAKGIGFVQFGEGDGAFVLDESASSLAGTTPGDTSSAKQPTIPSPSQTPAHGGWHGTRIALAHNTFANEWLTPLSVNRRFKQAVEAGVNYVYLSPKWADLEPSPGKYKFNDVDFQVGQADKAGLPTILNLRVIDTGNRPIPADLKYKSFDDKEMIDRFNSLIDALIPHLNGHTAYLLIGNEIDPYFKAHQNEVATYATFFQAAKAHAQAKLNGIPTSTTVTFGGLDKDAKELRPILRQTDFFSLTYYPLNPDFTVRDPSVIGPDFDRIIRAADGKQILFQEVGYPSSDKNNSSQEKQAQAFANLLDLVAEHKSVVIGADFLFMSDFSDAVTKNLAASYQLQNVDRFSAYLQSLGMFDSQGNPKKSWAVFTAKVPQITGSN